MQTRQPNKRVNWIFVIVLIIAIPLIIFLLIMINTVNEESKEKFNSRPNQELQE